ncbi:pyridoxamine 5'-phosphate oxidase family protein [candidate division WWE3 bacterium]|nr:pyridoxamine 5'-phosphate oxidase family protein [candidate division WWE3 bacterium]
MLNTNDTREDKLMTLKSFPIMNIATINKSNPLSSVVLFYVDNDLNFYFVTRENSYKAKSLLEDNKISFSVWNQNQMIVQADGVASVFVDKENKIINEIVESLKLLGEFWPPLLSFSESDYILFKIKPNWLRALNIKDQKIATEKPSFTFIDL